MNINAVIIDDEKSNIENLSNIINKYCENIEVIATADNAMSGIDIINNHNPDLVFLDIEMPYANGFQLLESIDEINFEVIFVTAYNQYAIKAVKFCALDYILKPIDIFELKSAVTNAESKIQEKKENQRIKLLIHNDKNTELKRIALSTLNEIEFIPIDDIIRCKSENNYTEFYLKNRKILISKPLKEYEELLSDFGFIRVHQSHLVNIKHIKSYIKIDGGYLLMADNEKVIISRNKKATVLQKIDKLII